MTFLQRVPLQRSKHLFKSHLDIHKLPKKELLESQFYAHKSSLLFFALDKTPIDTHTNIVIFNATR